MAGMNGFTSLEVGCVGRHFTLRIKPTRVKKRDCLATARALDFTLGNSAEAERILAGDKLHSSIAALGMIDSKDMVLCAYKELEPTIELQGGIYVTGKAAESVSGAVSAFLEQVEGSLTPPQRRIITALLLLAAGFRGSAEGDLFMDPIIETIARNLISSEDAPIINALLLRKYLDLRISMRPFFEFIRICLLKTAPGKLEEYRQAAIDLRELCDPLQAKMVGIYEARILQIRGREMPDGAKIIPLPLGSDAIVRWNVAFLLSKENMRCINRYPIFPGKKPEDPDFGLDAFVDQRGNLTFEEAPQHYSIFFEFQMGGPQPRLVNFIINHRDVPKEVQQIVEETVVKYNSGSEEES